MYENVLFWKIFARRSAICFFTIVLLFFSCILRVAIVATDDYGAVLQNQNFLKIKIGNQRGTIFDCNMCPITNNTKKIIAAVSPTPRAVTAISTVLEGEALNNVLVRLKSGKPVLCEVPRAIEYDGIICTEIYETDNNGIATHILGYTDSDNSGRTGIEAAYDDILNFPEEAYISYECNGKGEIFEGIEPTVFYDTSILATGVVTSLDINIQNIAEKAADSIEKGAVVIADCKTGKIRATVSRPIYDINDISKSLNAPDSPLLNRAINAYNVGSVFKPCVAIAGIEAGKSTFSYTCTGRCEIAERFFKCHKYDGHGFTDLKSGLANSCNTYFYNFAFNIGKNVVYNAASSLQFGKSLKICDGISTAKGSIPAKATLSNIAQLANFSIGQGELLLSPVSILTLYCAIAGDGSYHIPSVVEGTLKDGNFQEYETGNPTRVMSKDTADILKKHLTAVLTDGTGKDAMPLKVTAAGKTATAQTGKFKNGIEICEGWFCGFFPAESPKYVVVVFSEDITRQSKTCGKIFAEIADSITDLGG